MTISTVKRLAADIMKVGESRVRISPDSVKEAAGAMTRSDVRGLIDKGIIKKSPKKGRASTKKRKRKTPGRKRGTIISQKVLWMEKVRAQRRFLNLLIEDGALEKSEKRTLYGKVKSGIFKNKRAFLLFLKENKLVAKDYEPPKPKRKPKKEKAAKPAPAKKKVKNDDKS